MGPGDWPHVAAIYAAGIATRNATFETAVPEWAEWDAAHLPDHRFVATGGEGVFPENEASLALHRRCRFRVVGTRERRSGI